MTAVLLDVTRADLRLVAVGERGIVLYSDDDGASWRRAPTPVDVTLTRVFFLSARKGWAVGHDGVVLSTDDGGLHWKKRLDRRIALSSLPEIGRLFTAAPEDDLFDVYFLNPRRGFVVGAYGLFLATQDGGRSWRSWQKHLPNPQGRHLYAIAGGGSEIEIAGERGALFRSEDAGETFVAIPTPYGGSYFGVLRTPHQVIPYGLQGHAYRSGNRGRSWTPIALPLTTGIAAATRLADGGLVFAGQDGAVRVRPDHSWSARPLRLPRPYPLTGVTQAADGALVFTGAGGVERVPIALAGDRP